MLLSGNVKQRPYLSPVCTLCERDRQAIYARECIVGPPIEHGFALDIDVVVFEDLSGIRGVELEQLRDDRFRE